jgi:hypothetical protein
MKQADFVRLITISPILAIGFTSQAVFAQATGGGKDLSVLIANCPSQQHPQTSFEPAGPIASLTGGAASSFAGVAIDAAVKYLTQEVSAKSTVSKSLTSSDENGLFGGNKCLYLYGYTLKLKEVLGSPFTDKSLANIKANNLTPFFGILRFEENMSGPSFSNVDGSQGAADATALLPRYFKPIVLFWHYSSFISTNCALFRDCGRRDAAVSLTVANPIDSTPSETKNKAVPLALAFSNARPRDIEDSLTNQRNMKWFTYSGKTAPVSNLEFTLVETSKPGALANALAQTATDNKKAIQETVKVIVYNPPARP